MYCLGIPTYCYTERMKTIILISALLLFSPWSFAQDKYCWVNGDNFHDFKVAINKDCKAGDLLWAVINGHSLDEFTLEFTLEQTIGQYCDFESEIIVRKRNNGSLYLQCILVDGKSRKRRIRD